MGFFRQIIQEAKSSGSQSFHAGPFSGGTAFLSGGGQDPSSPGSWTESPVGGLEGDLDHTFRGEGSESGTLPDSPQREETEPLPSPSRPKAKGSEPGGTEGEPAEVALRVQHDGRIQSLATQGPKEVAQPDAEGRWRQAEPIGADLPPASSPRPLSGRRSPVTTPSEPGPVRIPAPAQEPPSPHAADPPGAPGEEPVSSPPAHTRQAPMADVPMEPVEAQRPLPDPLSPSQAKGDPAAWEQEAEGSWGTPQPTGRSLSPGSPAPSIDPSGKRKETPPPLAHHAPNRNLSRQQEETPPVGPGRSDRRAADEPLPFFFPQRNLGQGRRGSGGGITHDTPSVPRSHIQEPPLVHTPSQQSEKSASPPFSTVGHGFVPSRPADRRPQTPQGALEAPPIVSPLRSAGQRFRPVPPPRAASQEPTVQIGQIDVVVESASPKGRTPAPPPARGGDFASRFYLRRL
jgi:hypothetical protein